MSVHDNDRKVGAYSHSGQGRGSTQYGHLVGDGKDKPDWVLNGYTVTMTMPVVFSCYIAEPDHEKMREYAMFLFKEFCITRNVPWNPTAVHVTSRPNKRHRDEVELQKSSS